MTIKPVFILSLPRSGSTLLQRVLATHPLVSTASEPWILLPLFYTTRREGTTTEYNHGDSAIALQDFISTFPEKKKDYQQAIQAFVLHLYRISSAKEATHFVDKTPRYHLIAQEILDTFPDARFIFLWRNPLAVAASMMSTWSQGKWNLHRFEIDLYEGVQNLLAARDALSGKSFSVAFEELVSSPQSVYPALFEYLELDLESASYESFNDVRLSGRMGDPTGVNQYQEIDSSTRDNWPRMFNNPVRRLWARKYLGWLGESRLNSLGYDKSELLDNLSRERTNLHNVASDLSRIVFRKLSPTPEQKELYRHRKASI